ncbi:Uncharacterized conserved protein YhdP, contains DUF3971 and AsmA2 domains [Alteromonadaceae bacterium Bs31]|nr:Uncharacterized conserved protein YhdP, contains DUF3971 and AsmA2 domains [Alteromonadaceae bacterium Bs31]
MVFISQRSLRRLARRFWGTLFTLVIALAVAVQLGREAFPLLNDYRDDISELIGKRLGVEISIGEVSASWSGLRPEVELLHVTVSSLDHQAIFSVDQATAQLSLVGSLFSASLRWRHLAFKNLHTTLEQSEEGLWKIKHLKSRPRKDSNTNFKDPLDVFLFGRRVELENASFKLEFRTGHESVLSIPQVTLENDKDFHRVSAYAGVLDNDGEQREHFRFLVEATGDPRDPENFQSKGYLALNQFPTERVVAAFAGKHWQQDEQQSWKEGHLLDLELWYEGNAMQGLNMRGRLRSDGLPLNVGDNIVMPDEMKADITGSWHPYQGWQLVLQQLALQWPEFSSPPLNLKINGSLDKKTSFGIDQINLAQWHQLASRTGLLQGVGKNVLDALQPQGSLRDVSVLLTSKEAGYFRLTGAMDSLGVKGFKGSPEADYVDGYVSASAFNGYVDIRSKDKFRMFFPLIYQEPFEFDSAAGRVAWQVDRERKITYVSSSRLSMIHGDEEANGYLHLSIPNVRDGREPQMTLAIGVEAAPVSMHKKYVPKVVPKNLYQWLGQSIGEGQASDLAFIYHGSISKKPAVKANIQLSANVHNGNLAFDPSWPALTGIDGRLLLDGQNLDVLVYQANLLGNKVSNAEIKLIENPEDEGHALTISGGLNSNAAAAMELLQNSPVRSVFGSTFDSWEFAGDVSAAIHLQVPLQANAKGLRQSVDVQFQGARVDMQDIELSIDQVSGDLSYQSDKGLSAKSLTGRLWGKKIAAHIKSPLVNEAKAARDTVVHFKGPVDVDDIRTWTKRPELGFVEGSSQVTGKLIIPAPDTQPHSIEIDLVSQLEGVRFSLPEPVRKSEEEKKDFRVNLKLLEGAQLYQFDYNNLVSLRLKSGDAIDTSAQVNIDEAPLPLKPGYFDVLGRVDKFDLLVWDEVRERYFEYLAESGLESDEELPIRLNLDIGLASLGDASIENIHVNGLGTEDQWDLRVESEVAAGSVVVNELESTIEVGFFLDYLHLEPEAASETQQTVADLVEPARSSQQGPEESVISEPDKAEEQPAAWNLSEIDLSKLTFPVRFQVEELSFAGEPYGRWAFDLKPLVDGIALSNIHANVRGMAIGEAVSVFEGTVDDEEPVKRRKYGKFSDAKSAGRPVVSERKAFQKDALANPQAEFIWRQDEHGNHSFFRGTLMATETGAVLEAWGFDRLIESNLGVVSAEVFWDGAPDEISIKTVQGQVIFDLEDGAFIRGANEADNGLLRLIALFNFDTIARRLKLDFSDLAKEGFGFESVHGEFDFQDGWIYINEPMVVDSTSSRIQLAGTLDVIKEEIDAELVATLPVAGDLTVAAALIAGLPAAIGVFIISHMFEEQVDKASSINYRVRGSWEDPKIKFRKIFDDSAAAEKGKEVKNVREKDKLKIPDDLNIPRVDLFDQPDPTPLPE